ncbi:Hypothetical protein ERWE_CDS_03690 [Ehrlichia ruminantium str. Welgevonden]|uniref:Uncharacterized protein n=1 Tax=Ehrlichia ruminantium (strain Welgevonden) TaxID=254945 RepID=A0A0H3M615_EHRRW|nr:Hypothetical protein ERWE_CDS_03690 [Ehrlichia ruminantium str. Welgevonden]
MKHNTYKLKIIYLPEGTYKWILHNYIETKNGTIVLTSTKIHVARTLLIMFFSFISGYMYLICKFLLNV